MKTHIKNLFPLPALAAGFDLDTGWSATAQTFTVLHSFTHYGDGGYPNGLVLSGNTLYGTVADGGSGGNGPQPILPHARSVKTSVKRILAASYGHPHNQ